MRKLVLTFIASGIFISSGTAQTLFTYGSNPVTKQEFLRVYQKNSLNKKPDFSEPALREYLDLYSLFRMKVREAELQHLDTVLTIQRELDNYRKQLSKNYLTDEEVSNKIVREAFDRSKEEIQVSHILITVPPGKVGPDTAAAYNKIDSIYNLVTKNKADFGALARQYSEDRGSKDMNGNIGYMTSLQTVYPFENAVYATPVGKVSAPFRTQFGYHILKVTDRRPTRGEVEVAQIMIAVQKSLGDEGYTVANKKMDSVQAELKKGASFESLVAKYSDDKYSKDNKGVLAPISVGKVTPDVENAVFALKNPGDISKPVRTEYGIHIMKLIRKIPPKPYDSVVTQLKKKVENDSRSQTARESYFEKVKQKHGFKEYPANLQAVKDAFAKIPDTGKDANTFKATDFQGMNKPVFTLGGKDYLQSDYLSFAETLTRGRLMGPKGAVVQDIYNMYVSRVVNDYQEHKLVDENEDFRNLMEEYRNGIMLFELMDRNVWGKASRDTVGLKAFYEQNKSKYLWEPGFSGTVYRFKDSTGMNQGMKLLAKAGTKDDELMKAVNTEATPDAVNVQHGRYEFTRFKDVPQTAIAKGKVTQAIKNADGTYTVVKVEDVYSTPGVKSLEDARGYAVAEYQDYLEKKWNEELRKKYPVKVDEAVFKSMVK